MFPVHTLKPPTWTVITLVMLGDGDGLALAVGLGLEDGLALEVGLAVVVAVGLELAEVFGC